MNELPKCEIRAWPFLSLVSLVLWACIWLAAWVMLP